MQIMYPAAHRNKHHNTANDMSVISRASSTSVCINTGRMRKLFGSISQRLKEDSVMHEKNGFYGWYFKCQSEKESIALIPAVHTVNGQKTCSIQLITDEESHQILLSEGRCEMRADRPCAKLGENVFSETGVRLNLHMTDFSVTGALRFGRPSLLRYDIMGPFCCVPFMECSHRVFSMRHEVNGVLRLNGNVFRFENGAGYIEGDRGCSFPKQYMWTQCFFEGGSLMLAVAEIPVGPARFTGIIGAVQLNGREYRLATYLGAHVASVKNREIIVRQGGLELTAALLERQSHPLQAPANGAMTRTIRENIACHARYQLRRKDRILFAFETERASFEYEYAPH